LRAGHLVMNRALSRMVPVEPGSRFVAEFVSVMFAI
jgi:2-keto-4-pentenoate hydratase